MNERLYSLNGLNFDQRNDAIKTYKMTLNFEIQSILSEVNYIMKLKICHSSIN